MSRSKPEPEKHPPPLRLGVVSYLNMLPVVYGLDELARSGRAGSRLEVIRVAPGPMADLMEREELDVGMVPVATVFAHPEWKIVGHSMIGSRGKVKSVLAMGMEPPERWTALHLDAQSRTSNAFIQVLLHRRFGAQPELLDSVPLEDWSPPATTAPGEAHLLIGTRALRWRDHWLKRGGHVIDLGEEWTRWTGLPFVYAVWAARPGVEAGPWIERIEALKDRNLGRLDEIVESWPDLTEERLTRAEAVAYLKTNIHFDLDEAALGGMARFYDEGLSLGLFPPGWRPRATQVSV